MDGPIKQKHIPALSTYFARFDQSSDPKKGDAILLSRSTAAMRRNYPCTATLRFRPRVEITGER